MGWVLTGMFHFYTINSRDGIMRPSVAGPMVETSRVEEETVHNQEGKRAVEALWNSECPSAQW